MNKRVIIVTVVAIIMLVVTMCGCASWEATFPDGTTVSGESFLMSIDSVEGVWESGAYINVSGAESDADAIINAIKLGIAIGAGGAVTP